MHGDDGSYYHQAAFNSFPGSNMPPHPPPHPLLPPLHHSGGGHQFGPGGGGGGGGSEEQLTVKCTGIPHYLKEIDLYKHFSAFGSVVKLMLARLSGPVEEEGLPKVYNEAMVQFEEAADARKCLGSPQSVLDNRFIKLFMSKENLIPPGHVAEYLASGDAEVYPGFHNEEHLLKQAGGKGGKGGRGGGGKGGKGGSGGRMAGKGGGRFAGRGGHQGEQDEEQPAVDEEAVQQQREQLKLAAKAKRDELKEQREAEAKQQYEELKQLRHQSDSISRKKEELLQAQIDQFRGMMSKVEKICGSDEAEKARMIESLESKVLALQASLQAVRNGQAGVAEGTGEGAAGARGYKGGYKGAGGRGGGYKGAGSYKGAGGRGAGKGYKGAAGRGGGGGRGMELDNRSQCLLVGGAPADFLSSAHVHFSK